MTTVLSEVLERFVPDVCVDVFSSYRVPLRQLARPTRDSMGLPTANKTGAGDASLVAATVGFTSKELSGVVLLASTFDVVALARPAGVAERALSENSASDWLMVRDWAGELANQVTGRVKNRLRPFNIALEVGTPTSLSGRAVAFALPKAKTARPFLFDARGRFVWLWFDAVFERGCIVTSDGDESAKEGDVLLF